MAYWWVTQNHTFKKERAGGYLWAPLKDKGGRTPHHWQTMTRVQAGDVIFSYFRKRIIAIGIAKGPAEKSPQPSEFGPEGKWTEEGWRVDVDYRDIKYPVDVPSIATALQTHLSEIHSPLDHRGSGNVGYLFSIPPAAGRFIGQQIDALNDVPIDVAISDKLGDAPLPETTRRALVDSRIGQGKFRKDLLALWGARCCVSGLDCVELLRASHIKPWKDSNNAERLDRYNGFPLAPQYDAAFDEGLITITDAGDIRVSSRLTTTQIKALAIDLTARIKGLTPNHFPYLEYHRKGIFQP